jgi:hypothetical protein
MSRRRDIVVAPKSGPFASLGAELGLLDATLDSVDSMSEAESGTRHASKATQRAGQAAVDAVNARRGRS